jgi:hypothetical protein
MKEEAAKKNEKLTGILRKIFFIAIPNKKFGKQCFTAFSNILIICFISFSAQQEITGQNYSFTRSIQQSSDDAEEHGPDGADPNNAGNMLLNSTKLEMVRDDASPSRGAQKVGLRFTNINIPKGATILNAYISFNGAEANAPNSNSSATSLTIHGQSADSPNTFNTNNNNISGRALTTASVNWNNIQAWNEDVNYNTPSITSIVQELVNRSGWISGNNMAVIISGSGSRTAQSWDAGGDSPPLLTIEYSIVTLSTAVTPVTVQGASNGAVNLTVTGGTPAYTYLWSNGATTQNITNIPVGTYTVTVTDSFGNTASATAIVNDVDVKKQLYLSGPGQLMDRIDPTVQSASIKYSDGIYAGAVKLGNSSFAMGNNVNSITFSHTTPADTELRYMLVGVSVRNRNGVEVSSVTYNGQALSLVTNVSNGSNARTWIYALQNPPTGTYNVVATFNAELTRGAVVGATTFSGVHPNTPLGTPATAANSNTSITLAIPSSEGDMIFNTVTKRNASSSFSTTQDQRWNGYTSETRGAASTTSAHPTNSSTTVDWTAANGSEVAIAGVAIKPEVGNLTTSFTQSPAVCSNLVIKSGQLLVRTYVNILDGTMPANPKVTATLKYDNINIIALNNPVYNTTNQFLTWTGNLGTDFTVPSGKAIQLDITTGERNLLFQIAYDHSTKPSFVEFTTSTYIDITSSRVFNAPFPGGTEITSAQNGSTVYVRQVVTDPFGFEDITGTAMNFSPSPSGTFNSVPIANTSCSRTYEYAWATPAIPGDYQITATAREGYENTVVHVKKTDFSLCPLSVAATVQTFPTCNAPNSGVLNIQISGGSGNFTWARWNGVTTTNGSVSTNSFNMTGLPAGSYTITVTSARGCTGTTSVVIPVPQPPDISASITQVTCFGGSNGAIIQTVTGGLAPYTYLWTGGISTKDRSNLTPGTYQITITDSGGCSTTRSYQVSQPSQLVPEISKTDPTCAQGGSVSFTVIGGGGTAPYTWNWTRISPAGSNNGIGYSITGLSSGSYTLTVTSSTGCTGTTAFSMVMPTNPVADAILTHLTCFNAGNGTINQIVSGGTPPFTYNWQNSGLTSKNRDQLQAGTYRVTVSDQKACTAVKEYTITQPDQLQLSLSPTHMTCNTNGAISLNISGGTAPYVADWQDIGGLDNILNRNGLKSGVYYLTITDSNRCTASSQTEISAAQCNDLVSICITDINQKFSTEPDPMTDEYFWTVPQGALITDGQGTATIYIDWSGVLPGAHTVCVRKINVCGESLDFCENLSVKKPDVSVIAGLPACIGGDLKLFGDGGTSFTWSGPSGFMSSEANPILYNINTSHSGYYFVTITDESGCRAKDSILIDVLDVPVVSMTIYDAGCGISNGFISLSVVGGTSPYQFQWSNGNTLQNNAALPKGRYTATVTDSNGCRASEQGSVGEVGGPNISADVFHLDCYNGNNGSILLDISGGTAPYNFYWSDGADTQNRNNLKSGSYAVTVLDQNGCGNVESFILTEPKPLFINSMLSHNLCSGQNSGSIEIYTSGGVAPYNIHWNDNSDQFQRNNLPAGSYFATVTDDNACLMTAGFVISEPPSALSLQTTKNNISCTGIQNGTINLTLTGGTAPYTYIWSAVENPLFSSISEDITGLDAGQYVVTVTDSRGCSASISTNIERSVELIIQAEPKHLSCFNSNDGRIDIEVTGGTPPYHYLWSDGVIAVQRDSISAGLYHLLVTDARFCKNTADIQINQPDFLEVIPTPDHIECFGQSNGAIQITVSGGTAPYSYSWSSGADTKDIDNLTAGEYSLTITDENECVAAVSIWLEQGKAFASDEFVKHVSCNGGSDGAIDFLVRGGKPPYSYEWSNGESSASIDQLTEGPYWVTFTDANQCSASALIILSEPTPLFVALGQQNLQCSDSNTGSIIAVPSGGFAPYTFLWSQGSVQDNISNLQSEAYSVTVTDGMGCTFSTSTTITSPAKIDVWGDIVHNCPMQSNGSIFSYASGGIPPYQYGWSDSGPNTSVRSGLPAGSYMLTVTDANNCSAIQKFDLIPLQADIFTVQPTCKMLSPGVSAPDSNGEIYITADGGMGSYSYFWSNAQTGNKATGLANGMYGITVTSGACAVILSTTLSSGVCVPPVANNDYYVTEKTVQLSGNVADNDYDPDFQYPFTVLPLAFIDPIIGILEWDSDFNGNFLFIPNPDFTGSLSVPYQVCDTADLCDHAILNITVSEPVLGINKRVANTPINVGEQDYAFSYDIQLHNMSALRLDSIQLTDSLGVAFTGAVSWFITGIESDILDLNEQYDGISDVRLLSGNNSLDAFETASITIHIQINPGSNLGPYYNSAKGRAISPKGVILEDLSQDGTDPDPDNDGDPTNNNDPTPVQLCPYVEVTGSHTICVGSATSLTAVPSGSWYSINPEVAQVNDFGIVVGISAGNTAFYFIESASGCVSNTTDAITVLPRPVISLTGAGNICAKSTTSLSPQTGGIWTSSNSAVASITNSGIVTGLTPGTVQFYYTNLSTGCTSSASTEITIRPNPAISFDADSVICVGEFASVSPKQNGIWTSSNPLVATVNNEGFITGISNGLSYLSFVTDLGCTTGAQLPVVVNGNTYVYNTGANQVCAGSDLQLMPNVNGTWISNTPETATITPDGIITGIAEGTAAFTFTDSGSGCTSALDDIYVYARPIAAITGHDTLCTGTSTQLSPDAGGFWVSSHPDVASVNSTGIVNALTAGKTTFIFTASATGCTSLPTDTVVVFQKPDAYLIDTNPICEGEQSYLFPTEGGIWQSTEPTVAVVSSEGIITGIRQGSARFIFTAESSGCESNPTSILVIHDKPSITLNGVTAICEGENTQLFPQDGGIWQSTDTDKAIITNTGLVTGVGEGSVSFIFTDVTTGCVSETSLPLYIHAAPQVSVSGNSEICAGYRTTLSPASGGVWTSDNINVASVTTTGLVTGIAPGAARFTFTDAITGCTSLEPTDRVVVSRCLNNDFNITTVNVSVSGDVSINDNVPPNTTYDNNPILLEMPAGSSPLVQMSNNGTYTFVTDKPGRYEYNIRVCVQEGGTPCPFTILEIFVSDLRLPGNFPFAYPDRAATFSNENPVLPGYPVTILSLANDQCLNGAGCILDPSTVEIIVNPLNGQAITDPVSGNIQYTPNAGFRGTDILTYKVCVLGEPDNCSSATQTIDVIGTGISFDNTTDATDDFYTTLQETSISGNVLLNDFDKEGDIQTVIPQGSSLNPVFITGGNYYLTGAGDFTFIPDPAFSGQVRFSYMVCDDNIAQKCARASVYIYVIKDLTLNIRVYLEGALSNNNNATTIEGRPLMRDNLRLNPFTGSNFIPQSDPYSFATEFTDLTAQYSHKGAGMLSRNCHISDAGAVFSVSGRDAIVDWVFVELRSKTDSTDVVATRSGLLQRDGDIVDMDGISPLSFYGVGADSFYIVVRHRNHLGVMSRKISNLDLVDLTSADIPVFDFGSALNNGFDYTGMARKCGDQSNYCAMWAGDFNGDGKLKFINPGDDQNILFFDVLVYPDNLINSANYNFGYGYIQGDLDLNGKAKYDNPNDDKNLLFSQILLHPLNTSLLSNFNFIIEQVPAKK